MNAAQFEPFVPSEGDPFDFRKAAHLLRRAGFGAAPEAVREAVGLGPGPAVKRLLSGGGGDDPDLESALAIGDIASHGGDPVPLRAAWAMRLLGAKDALRERMTLFWHGHFATANAKVQSPRLMWLQHLTLRRLSLAPFGEVLAAVTRDPAMLVWLDGAVNRKGSPNENYARELFELFALGIGHYSESDIREAARALTGLSLDGSSVEFRASRHDDGEKTVFGKSGRFGPDELLALTLDRDAAAPFVARKIARVFLADEPDEGIVAPLASEYRRSGFDTAGLVESVLRSRLFYSKACVGSRVRGPAEHVAGAVRSLGLLRVPPADAARAIEEMGQTLFDPPNVKGWDGGRAWIGTATWLRRLRFAADVAGSPALDPESLARALKADPGDDARMAAALLDALVEGGATERLALATAEAARAAGGGPDARVRAAVRFVLSLPEAQLG